MPTREVEKHPGVRHQGRRWAVLLSLFLFANFMDEEWRLAGLCEFLVFVWFNTFDH